MEDRNEIRKITMAQFFPYIVRMKEENWRLVQICAASVDDGKGYEMSYTFCNDPDYHMITLRVELGEGEEIASITQIYPCAFIQENEAAELFGVKINHINMDYQNKLYRIDVAAPFRKKG